ncbi:MAG: glycosyltransferase [Marinobacter sp.]|nr:glycosyltransferase [Marinobacter sp.]
MPDSSIKQTQHLPNARLSRLIQILFVAGLGSALLSSSVFSATAVALVIAGIWIMTQRLLAQQDWDRPKELRLLHFGFWFFAGVSLLAWAAGGFSYEALKQLDNHLRLLLFWPLVIAFTYAAIKPQTLLLGCALTALAASLSVVLGVLDGPATWGTLLQHRAGWGINAIVFGNLALLVAMMTLVGMLLAFRQGSRSLALLLALVALLGLAAAYLSQTRSNLLAFPLLALLLLPLVSRTTRWWLLAAALLLMTAAILGSQRFVQTLGDLSSGHMDLGLEYRLIMWQQAWQLFTANPWLGAGLTGYTEALQQGAATGALPAQLAQCCSGHAHNDMLHLLATRGIWGGLSGLFLILAPLILFARQIGHRHTPAAHLAVAGTMIPVAYLVFGLTEATLNRSLYLTTYLVLVSAFGATLYAEISRSHQRARQVRVSATIITKNEEAHIEACIRSARLVADEIIVLDSGSSDRTVEIARQYADIVEVTDWPGFGVQKQRALEKATGDWVLSIDADERITPALAREINHTLAAPDADAYKLPWAVTLYGTRLDFGRSGRAPLRLFRREGVRFSDALVHERILIPKSRTIKSLRGRLTHYTHRDFGHALEKSAKYAWLGSQQKYRKNKRTRWLLYPTFRGILTFIQVYFVRFGFLDGAVGYLVAVTYAQGSFNKYAGLWTLTRTSQKRDAV